MTSTNYDVIVIGTSQGGRFLPIAFAKAGRKVALIERDHMGGVCVNVGCTPTKTMVASARLAYLARRGAEYGVRFLAFCPCCSAIDTIMQRPILSTCPNTIGQQSRHDLLIRLN